MVVEADALRECSVAAADYGSRFDAQVCLVTKDPDAQGRFHGLASWCSALLHLWAPVCRRRRGCRI